MTYIGIDVSKKTIDICLLSEDRKRENSDYLKLPNSIEGYNRLIDICAVTLPDRDLRFGFESTSTYMVSLQRYLSENGLDFVLINPAKIFHFMKSLNVKHKTVTCP